MENNGVMMQFFQWYYQGDLWKEVIEAAPKLAKVGIDALWLPPAYKGQSSEDVGYGVYDLYDLGEFDQKGTVRTKYGTRDEFLQAVKAAQDAGIKIYADIVLNHRLSADETETVVGTPFDRKDRHNPVGPPREIEAYTKFDFAGRAGKYSKTQLSAKHFDSVDFDNISGSTDLVYMLAGKAFDRFVDGENKNFDYLMGCDFDFDNIEVRDELEAWGKWFLDTTGVDGFRLDALKHIPAWFFITWLDRMRQHKGEHFFCVGEYWHGDVKVLQRYLRDLNYRFSLFDVSLHYNLHKASIAERRDDYDLRGILKNTLVEREPQHAVTFVDNHDTQPLEGLESPVQDWFKPMAYALTLLRQGGYPCVFYGDYYGAEYNHHGKQGKIANHGAAIDKLLDVRRNYAYGKQIDYFEHKNLIGWLRLGTAEQPRSMAVLISNGPDRQAQRMQVNRQASYVNILGDLNKEIVSDGNGWASFTCDRESVAVWVEKD